MKTDQWQGRIGGAILALSLLSFTAIALSTTARAQDPNDRGAQGRRDRNRDRDRDRDNRGDHNRRGRNWDAYGTYGGSFQLRQTALNAGYNEGIKQGRNDRNRRNGSDYRNRSAYQKATKDYSPRLGDRELYRRYYREGYENGFNDGVNGY
jgi:hypothetical protein